MDADKLSAIAGIVLSLAFSYVPGVKDWFAKRTTVEQRGIMVLSLFIVAVGIFGLSCSGLWQWVECSQSGAVGLVEAFVLALIANQAAYSISPASSKK